MKGLRWSHVGLALMLLSLLWLFSCSSDSKAGTGDFYGIQYAMIETFFPNVVVLLWTNPPDLDLYKIQFFAQKVGQTDSIAFPPYYGRRQDDNDPYVLRPGMPDSIWAALPCRAFIATDWRFWSFNFDTAGNMSLRSNIATWRQWP